MWLCADTCSPKHMLVNPSQTGSFWTALPVTHTEKWISHLHPEQTCGWITTYVQQTIFWRTTHLTIFYSAHFDAKSLFKCRHSHHLNRLWDPQMAHNPQYREHSEANSVLVYKANGVQTAESRQRVTVPLPVNGNTRAECPASAACLGAHITGIW